MLFSRNAPSSQIQQSPSITFQGCVSNFSLLVTRGLGRMWLAQHWYLTTSRKLARACTLVMQQDVPCCSRWTSAGHPLSPLLGRGGRGARKLETERGRESSQLTALRMLRWPHRRKQGQQLWAFYLLSLPPKPVPLPTLPQTSILARATLWGHKNREDSEEKTFQSSFANGINSVPKYVWLQKSAEEPCPYPKVWTDLKNIKPIATLRWWKDKEDTLRDDKMF